MIDIREQVMRGAAIADEGKFDFDRTKFLNGSEAGGCIRKQWYDKHGAEQAEQDWGYARRGSHGEKYLVENLIQSNVPIALTGKEQWSIQDKKRRISVTPDGLIQYDDEWIPVEFKTIDPRTNRNYLPKEQHVTQLQIAMEMIDEQMDRLPGVKMDHGLLVYMDASNFNDITQHVVTRDKSILDRMAKRAKKVLDTVDVAVLDREGKRNGGKECQTMCAFKGVCGVTAEDASSRKRANRGSNMDGAAVRYMELKDQEAAISVEKATLSEDIKNELHTRKVNRGVVGNIEVSLSVAKGRASLDRKRVAAAGIDLSPFETVGASSERLTLKRV
tara:strand:+ start:114 stop:1106 length:993 start_codon:yes stop_codon:yes gene_type:complete